VEAVEVPMWGIHIGDKMEVRVEVVPGTMNYIQLELA
jgi:hypothetical protein